MSIIVSILVLFICSVRLVFGNPRVSSIASIQKNIVNIFDEFKIDSFHRNETDDITEELSKDINSANSVDDVFEVCFKYVYPNKNIITVNI